MTFTISDPEADALARRLAELEGAAVADAVVKALKEAIETRTRRETPTETAQRLLALHGLSFTPNRGPVPPDAYHELDHDLIGDN